MEEIIENIVELVGGSMPELRLVDEDYGQLEAAAGGDRDTYPLTCPAVLIDAPNTDWSNIAGTSQKGLATVRVRLVIDCYDDTHYTSGTTGRIRERAELRRKLFDILQGHRVDSHSALIRTSSRFYNLEHLLKVYEENFTVEVTEMHTDPRKQAEDVSPRIKVSIKKA